MIFDDDAILLSFFARYTEPDEEEELKESVMKYINKGLGGARNMAAQEESTTTGESLDDVS